MHLDLPISMQRYVEYEPKSNGKAQSNIHNEMETQGYLRVPVWVIVLLITIAGGLILNGATTVYWAATLKQSFQDFKEETYKQKTEQLQKEILQLQQEMKAEAEKRQLEDDVLTERQNDTRMRLAGKGLITK